MKRRSLIVLDREEEQLLNDLTFLLHGSVDKKKSETIIIALKRMANEYQDDLTKLDKIRRRNKRRLKVESSKD